MSARAAARGALAALALAVLLAGCGSSGSGQSGSAFVSLSVNLFSLNGSTAVAGVNSSLSDRNVSTVVCATLGSTLKNPTVTAPTALDNVVIRSYTVSITRSDGGPDPGPFTFNTSVLVPAGTVSQGAVTGNSAVVPVILVPASAKSQPPLSPAPRLPLTAVAEILFKGRDGRGSGVETRGAVGLTFLGGDATDAAASCGTPATGGGGGTGTGGGSSGGGSDDTSGGGSDGGGTSDGGSTGTGGGRDGTGTGGGGRT